MVKNRIAVILLAVAISSSFVACKSDTGSKETSETTQSSSDNVQADVLSTGGKFNKLLVSNNGGTTAENSDGSSTSESDENSETTESTTKSRPPIGLAVRDSKDMVDIEEEKVIGSIDYDIIDISEFKDCTNKKSNVQINDLSDSVQAILTRFNDNEEQVVDYLAEVCDRCSIDVSTVEASRGLKTDKDLAYKVIVAHNDKYNIYLAINKSDLTAKFSVKEK